ncbi:hypothetical protein [Capnocytophaga catalasegens]|uniref:Uncharacterized protein n=1 Tax=Capnocytophaga catalasegens TaxID=1004260 RepID=A0AAV5AW53_9FLAO|nr:hypothetical protein [Capnocytophaga catalasegens]GIZ15552.1 hypothetical protein RCZ03_15520 [Capnocytophaga catalasegens]GJM49895.1 hypothetical protein RCZ15_08700 [Capnocytophaga catalasegens]GJM54067.1 hypothetical protein RCZ16_23830 [Capnocytophaga catalasegens]
MFIGCSKGEIELQQTIVTQARVFYLGIESPNPDIGITNDLYINQITMQYYIKSSEGWGKAYQ